MQNLGREPKQHREPKQRKINPIASGINPLLAKPPADTARATAGSQPIAPPPTPTPPPTPPPLNPAAEKAAAAVAAAGNESGNLRKVSAVLDIFRKIWHAVAGNPSNGSNESADIFESILPAAAGNLSNGSNRSAGIPPTPKPEATPLNITPLEPEVAQLNGNELKIGSKTYIILGFMGKGSYGDVMEACCDGSYYAIKTQNLEGAIKEANNLKQVQGIPNTAQLVQLGQLEGKGVLVTHYVPGSIDLKHDLMKSKELKHLKIEMIALEIKNPCFDIIVEENLDLRHKIKMIDIIVKLLKTISEIHARKLVHGDIKPANIVVDPKTNDPYVIDFGVSDSVDTQRGKTTGSPYYMDSNAFNGIALPNSDYSALGVTAHEILTGSRPGMLNADNVFAALLAGQMFKDKCTKVLNAHYRTAEAKKKAPIFECLLNDLVSKIDELPTRPDLRNVLVENLNSIKSKLESELELECLFKSLASETRKSTTKQTRKLIKKVKRL